jgi:hypothetical protein
MASKTVSAPKIIKGPSCMDLMDAMFFNRNKVLMFNLDKRVRRFDGQSQLEATLLGMIPSQVPQTSNLVLRHRHKNQSCRVVAIYNDHYRSGWFTWADTLDEILDENWNEADELAWHPGKPPITILVAQKQPTRGRGEYHAHIDKQPWRQSIGATVDEAVGNLVNAHLDQFHLPSDVDLKGLDNTEIGEMVLDEGRELGIRVRR